MLFLLTIIKIWWRESSKKLENPFSNINENLGVVLFSWSLKEEFFFFFFPSLEWSVVPQNFMGEESNNPIIFKVDMINKSML